MQFLYLGVSMKRMLLSLSLLSLISLAGTEDSSTDYEGAGEFGVVFYEPDKEKKGGYFDDSYWEVEECKKFGKKIYSYVCGGKKAIPKEDENKEVPQNNDQGDITNLIFLLAAKLLGENGGW